MFFNIVFIVFPLSHFKNCAKNIFADNPIFLRFSAKHPFLHQDYEIFGIFRQKNCEIFGKTPVFTPRF